MKGGSTRFSDHLRALAAPIWQAQQEHPFVRGIGQGTLDLEKFKHWVRQDWSGSHGRVGC